MPKPVSAPSLPGGIVGFFARLHSIKLGGAATPEQARLKGRDLAYILNNLATLLENGLSLPKALLTLSRERSLVRYRGMLEGLRKRLEVGESFSGALAHYPHSFPQLLIGQVRVGERSGTLAATLSRIAAQIEQSNDLRQKIIKKLSYPIIVTLAGSGVIVFLLTFVVPQFEETYRHAKIPLPLVTRFLMAFGKGLLHHGWWVLLVLAGSALGVRRLRQNPEFAGRMDLALMKLPLVGGWLRNIAVLQFMEVLGVMMESGFKLVDALTAASGTVNNQAMRACIDQLRLAVTRGEKLSTELDRHGDMFPPVVSQLVIVGEQTGNLSRTTGYVREHLRKQIERQAEWLVGMLEPVLTIGMAVAIGIILLAIYLPMFGMIDAVDGPKPPA